MDAKSEVILSQAQVNAMLGGVMVAERNAKAAWDAAQKLLARLETHMTPPVAEDRTVISRADVENFVAYPHRNAILNLAGVAAATLHTLKTIDERLSI